ncbi:hypothetical protein P9272_11780 [Mesorhizobium sp. WSM4976]|uniref:hypothetical protein n=1 Tax=Mesorhizobium sp. WSM4976 TaxID=3038549 RepID=UPI002415C20E|nr:hypothetical protein [Mesorhizobium sp. WSM4976]MDG4894248.1 hypothetical protein [Mesorhizobium sp. WSM4976]
MQRAGRCQQTTRHKEKFEDAARELKTDQSDEAFEAALGKIAHAPKLTNEQIKELARRKRESGED